MRCFYYIKLILLSLFFIHGTCSKTKEFTSRQNIYNFHGPLTYESDNEIKMEMNRIREFILKNEVISKTTSVGFLSIEQDSKHHDTILCKSCLWLYDSIQHLLLKKYGWNVLFEFATLICSLGLNYNICKEYVFGYGASVTESLIYHYLNGGYICTWTKMCKNEHFIYLNPDDYARELLKDKPTNKTLPIIDTEAKTWKVLHISDIHVDLNYTEGSRGLCPEALCCREESQYSKSTRLEDSAGRWGFPGRCDLPLRTLINFCDTVFNELIPDFIIWTGDSPAHDYYDKSALEVAKQFTNLIKNKFNNNLPVYPLLGNHEKYPADQYYPFDNTTESSFLRNFGDLWRDWLGEEGYESFIKFGAYSKKHLNTNLRIVATNCMLCDVLNFNLIRNPTDPQTQIEWLEKILRQAEVDNELIYLIGHIPPGDSAFLSECSKRYKALFDRFSYIIRGQFYGHTHYDEIKIMHEYFDKNKISSVIFIAPSLTTFSFLNPSYRILEIDSNTKLLKDYYQYRLNLTKANLYPDENPKWDLAYKASEFFNVTFLNDTVSLAKYSEDILTDNTIFVKTAHAFFSGGPLVEEFISTQKMPKYLQCRFTEDIFDNYYKCIGYFTWDNEEYAYKLLNIIDSSWYTKLPY